MQRQLKTHEIPKWAYETPQYWDSTDVHPLRDLSMLFGAACDDLVNKHKDGMTLDKVKMHDAVCALKDVIPTPYKDQFKVLDVGFYTLAQTPYINQPDIKNYLWDKQAEIINHDYAAFPYRLVIAKQFKPNGKYADFRVGLKLPRATTGMFEKMNDAVEEALSIYLQDYLLQKYKASGDIMFAETEGVKKLQEILMHLDVFAGKTSDILRSKNAEVVPLFGGARERAVGLNCYKSLTNQALLSDNIKDYAALEIEMTNNPNTRVLMRSPLKQFLDRPNIYSSLWILTHFENSKEDIAKAKNDFESNEKDLMIWVDYVKEPDNTTRTYISYRFKKGFNISNARKRIQEQYEKVSQSARPAIKNNFDRGSSDCNLPCPNIEFDLGWRTKKPCAIMDCPSVFKDDGEYTKIKPLPEDDPTFKKYIPLASNGGEAFLQEVAVGTGCGFIDALLDVFSNIYQMNSIVSNLSWDKVIDAGVALVDNVYNYCSKLYEYCATRSAWDLIQEAEDSASQNIRTWKNNIYQAFEIITTLLSNYREIFTALYGAIMVWLGDALTNAGKEIGYELGQMAFDAILAFFTAGVGGVALKASKILDEGLKKGVAYAAGFFKNSAFKEFCDAIIKFKNNAKDFSNYLLEKFKGYADDGLLKACKVFGLGCFTVGTPVLAANGHLPIEQLQLGQQVFANTKVNNGYQAIAQQGNIAYLYTADAAEKDWLTSDEQRNVDATNASETWYSLHLELPKIDGTKTKIQLLRPKEWLKSKRIDKIGDGIHLSMPEMGAQGYATVTHLAHCRNSKALDSEAKPQEYSLSAVTGIFEHTASEHYKLVFDQSDSLGVTAMHPFYVFSKGWIATEHLNIGTNS